MRFTVLLANHYARNGFAKKCLAPDIMPPSRDVNELHHRIITIMRNDGASRNYTRLNFLDPSDRVSSGAMQINEIQLHRLTYDNIGRNMH
jgi:hypothetical protein